MRARADRIETRNPILQLEAMKAILALPPESREAIAALLKDLSADANRRAHLMWAKNKGPMAGYWMAVRAISGNIRRAVIRGSV